MRTCIGIAEVGVEIISAHGDHDLLSTGIVSNSTGNNVGDLNMKPPDMPFWYKDYFEPKTMKKQISKKPFPFSHLPKSRT